MIYDLTICDLPIRYLTIEEDFLHIVAVGCSYAGMGADNGVSGAFGNTEF